MPAIQDPRTAKEPRTPTAGRMKNRPGAAEPSGGALLSRAGCRGTYPPPAAGCMVTAFRWTGIISIHTAMIGSDKNPAHSCTGFGVVSNVHDAMIAYEKKM